MFGSSDPLGMPLPLNRIPLPMSSFLESNLIKTSIIHEEIQIVNKHVGERFTLPSNQRNAN